MQIPLPTGLRGSDIYPKQIEVLKNCYFHPGDIPTIKTRPVADDVADSIGRCRGSGKFKDDLYHVSNDRLVRITIIDSSLPLDSANIAITNVGEIPGIEDCILVSSFTQMIVLRKGGAAYTYDTVNGVREITDANYEVSISVDYDPNGNWVFVPLSGDPFFFCNDADLFLDPASAGFRFADAQEFTDKNKCVIVRRRQIFVGGSGSFERLSYSPELDTYLPITGATSNYGYVGGLVRYEDTFMWLGKGVNGGYSFFIMGERATPLDNDYVNSLLLDYNISDLENIKAYSFRWKNLTFAAFYLPGITLVFSGDWSIWHTGSIGDGEAPWRVCFMQDAYGYIWAGDLYGRTVSVMKESDTEYSDQVEGSIQTYMRSPERQNTLIRRIFLSANTGINKSGQSVGLQISQNGAVFGPLMYISLGDIGKYNKELSWGPIGKIRDAISMRFVWSGFINIAIDGISAK